MLYIYIVVVTLRMNRTRKSLLADGDVDLKNDEGFGFVNKIPFIVLYIGESNGKTLPVKFVFD